MFARTIGVLSRQRRLDITRGDVMCHDGAVRETDPSQESTDDEVATLRKSASRARGTLTSEPDGDTHLSDLLKRRP